MFDINDTLAKVRKARFSDRLVIEDEYGDEYTVTQRDLDNAQPVTDIQDWLDNVNTEEVTTADLEKLMTMKSKRVKIGDVIVQVKALSKVKTVRDLEFPVYPYTAALSSKGSLAIGCQTHSLDEWGGANGDNIIGQRYDADQPALREARDVIIPILRKKLAAERAKHPVKTKRRAA